MPTQYQNLTDLLNNNPELGNAFFLKYHGKVKYLNNLESLVSVFPQTHKSMLIEKIKETSTLDKLDSLISEIITAKIFSQKGCNVKLLSDNYSIGPSPDILCDNQNLSFFVEVTRFSDGGPTLKIIEELRELLHTKPFIAHIKYRDNLSVPCYSWKERKKQEEILEKSLMQFKKELASLPLESEKVRISTDGIHFSLEKREGETGYPGGFSSVYEFPTGLFEQYVKDRLLHKAKKRTEFKGKDRDYPYIIAFVSEDISIDDIDFHDLLYGRTRTFSILPFDNPETTRSAITHCKERWKNIVQEKEKYIPKWQRIQKAANDGWFDFLTTIHYIPNNYTFLEKDGLFLSESLMKNVSGVMLIRKSSESFFFPNPFCYNKISIRKFQSFFNSLKS